MPPVWPSKGLSARAHLLSCIGPALKVPCVLELYLVVERSHSQSHTLLYLDARSAAKTYPSDVHNENIAYPCTRTSHSPAMTRRRCAEALFHAVGRQADSAGPLPRQLRQDCRELRVTGVHAEALGRPPFPALLFPGLVDQGVRCHLVLSRPPRQRRPRQSFAPGVP